MAIKSIKEKKSKKMEIDLTGPDGNAFNLINIARNLSNKLGKNTEEITDDMMSGDYDHLVWVFNKHFGDYVDLYK